MTTPESFQKITYLERDCNGPILYVPHYLPGGSAVKNLPAMQETFRSHGFNPWVRKIPGEGNGNLRQYSCLENPKDTGLQSIGVTKSWTRLR